MNCFITYFCEKSNLSLLILNLIKLCCKNIGHTNANKSQRLIKASLFKKTLFVVKF